MARRVAVPVEILWSRIAPKGLKLAPHSGEEGSGTAGKSGVLSVGEIPAAERRILQILLSDSECKSLVTEGLKDDFLTHPMARRVVEALRTNGIGPETVDFQRQIAQLTEEERIFVSGIALEEHPDPRREDVESTLKLLETRSLEREAAEIQREIERADPADEARLSDLMRNKEQVARRRSRLGRSRKPKGTEFGD